MEEETLTLSGARIDVLILTVGEGEFLARGEVADMRVLQEAPLTNLRDKINALQMDVFEEDGRLLKRITQL